MISRKRLAIAAIALLCVSLFLVALTFVPVYTLSTGDGGITYYNSIDAMLGWKAYVFVGFEVLLGLLGFVILMPFSRNLSTKVIALIIALLFIGMIALYVASYYLGRDIFFLDPTHSPSGFSLFH